MFISVIIMAKEIIQSIPISDLIRLMDFNVTQIEVEFDSGTTIEHKFEIQASDFMNYAELDLQQNTEHGLVNALSNAKRAIDCQIDTVLGCFGLLSSRKFPQKMEILHDIGIIAPRIINKVIKARNYLEHEYVKPEKELVEDAVDIASLFVHTLDKSLRYFNSNYTIQSFPSNFKKGCRPRSDKGLYITFDEERKQYNIRGFKYYCSNTPEYPQMNTIGEVVINPGENGYLELIKIAYYIDDPQGEDALNKWAIQFINMFI
jgi:hypothetical protein